MAIRKRRRQFFLFWNPPPPFWQIFISTLDFKIDVPPRIIVASVKFIKNSKHWSSPSVNIFLPISDFSYFVIRFLNRIFFVINFSYFIIRFLLNSSIVKSDNEIGKVNDKKNMI